MSRARARRSSSDERSGQPGGGETSARAGVGQTPVSRHVSDLHGRLAPLRYSRSRVEAHASPFIPPVNRHRFADRTRRGRKICGVIESGVGRPGLTSVRFVVARGREIGEDTAFADLLRRVTIVSILIVTGSKSAVTGSLRRGRVGETNGKVARLGARRLSGRSATQGGPIRGRYDKRNAGNTSVRIPAVGGQKLRAASSASLALIAGIGDCSCSCLSRR